MKNFIRFSGFAFLFLINLAGGGVIAQQLTLTASDFNGYNISCFGGNNGSIDLTITGGTPPYTILWSNDQVTEDIADLPAGYYRVTVDDADTLTMPVEAEITLTEPRRMDISYQAYQYPNGFNISVYGACNGSIDLSVTEGVSPYTYSWNDGPTTQDRSAVCASTYRVIITDLNGCQASSESIFMKEPNRGDWQLDGNTSIDPNTQFIGSVDSTDLVFRTNNQERFRIGSNGQLTLGGEIFSFGGINFGDNKTIKYQPPGGGLPGIFSIGQDPSVGPFSISNCLSPTLNTLYQFNGTIQLYGNSASGGNLINVFEIGFDGANAIIEATGSTINPTYNRLLINYVCGHDVFICTGTNGGNIQLGSNSSSIGIGTSNFDPTYKLLVNGAIRAKKVVVDIGWSDYVFHKDYKLMTIDELAEFIHSHKHLPNIPPAKDIEENGLDVGSVQAKQMEKIEEMALYIIQLNKKIEAQKERIDILEMFFNK